METCFFKQPSIMHRFTDTLDIIKYAIQCSMEGYLLDTETYKKII